MSRGPQQRAHWHNAYDAQMGLWRWYRTTNGRAFMSAHYADNAKGVMPDSRDMLGSLYGMELIRLLDCDPIFVSEDMCVLVDVAREDFKPEPLLETDLMTTNGFLWWDTPITVPDRFDQPMHLMAVSWQHIYNGSDKKEGFEQQYGVKYLDAPEEFRRPDGTLPFAYGLAITLYCETRSYLKSGGMDFVEGLPPVLPMHLTPWYFGMTFDGNEWDEYERPTGAEWWWRVCQVTFRLMQQKLAHRTLMRPDRALRREAKAAGLPHESEIVVVRLRREDGPRKEPSGESANYSHRFLRAGHWRNQWYPSIQAHRQIRIQPTIVGDPGLPLIVRPRRVFQWEK